MKYRKNIDVSDATEDELIRFQMEQIVKSSSHEEACNLGECSGALAKLYELLKYRHLRFIIGAAVFLDLLVGFIVLITQIFN